jgi:hypothetical protein
MCVVLSYYFMVAIDLHQWRGGKSSGGNKAVSLDLWGNINL